MEKITKLIRVLSAHTVVQNSAVVMGGSMVANVLAYLYHLVVGRILGPEQYSELAALFSLFYILNVPSSVVQTVLTKFFSVLKASDKSGEAKYLFFSSLRILVVLSLVGLIPVALSVNAIAAFLNIRSLVNFYWLYAIFSLFFIGVVPVSFLAAHQRFREQSVLSVLGMLLRLIFAVLAAPFGVMWTLISNAASNIVMFGAYYVPLRQVFSAASVPLSLTRSRAIGYSVPTLLTTLAIAALYNQDVLLVKHFFSPAEAGIYSSLSVLGKVIYYASSALAFVLFPVISERKELKRSHQKLVFASLSFVAFLSGALTVFYFLFPGLIVDLLYGSSYRAAVSYVGLFGVFISFFTLDNILFTICLATEKTGVWMIAIAGALAQLVLLWVYHASLNSIIVINIWVAVMLFVVLLIYYTHAKESV